MDRTRNGQGQETETKRKGTEEERKTNGKGNQKNRKKNAKGKEEERKRKGTEKRKRGKAKERHRKGKGKERERKGKERNGKEERVNFRFASCMRATSCKTPSHADIHYMVLALSLQSLRAWRTFTDGTEDEPQQESLCAFCREVVPTKPFTNTALY